MSAGSTAGATYQFRAGSGLAESVAMDLKKWKSGQHVKPGRWPDPELLHSVNQVKRFRLMCPYCMEHKRTCPVCAGVY